MKFLNISEIAEVISGQSPPSSTYNDNGDGLPFYQGKTDFGEKNPIPRKWCSKPKRIAEKNDILISVRAPVGPVNIALENSAIGRGLAAIRVKKDNDYLYLYYYLKNNPLIISRYATGSTFSAISRKEINRISIPIPNNSSNQKRIAKVLLDCETLINKRKESIVLLDELLKSTFLEMFGNPVSNEKGWDFKTIKEHIGKVSTGNTPPRKDKDNFGDFIEWIKTNNIDRNEKYLSTSREYLSKKGKGLGRIVQSNSLLVTCIAGSIKSIGNIGITNREVAFNQQINAITPNKDVDIEFLYWMFFISKSYLESKANKGMKKMISKSDFEKMKFPKPDFNLQLKFSKISRKAETIKQYYQTHLQELENLYNSISQKAFKGELDLYNIKIPEDNTRFPDIVYEKPINTLSKEVLKEIIIKDKDEPLVLKKKLEQKNYKITDVILLLSAISSTLGLSMATTFPIMAIAILFQIRTEDVLKYFKSKGIDKNKSQELEAAEIELFTEHYKRNIDKGLEEGGFLNFSGSNKLDSEVIDIDFEELFEEENYLDEKKESKEPNEEFLKEREDKSQKYIEEKYYYLEKKKIKNDIISKSEPKIQKWEEISSQKIAKMIKSRYSDDHFSLELLTNYLEKRKHIKIAYYSSEELKKNPELNTKQDLKNFIFSAIEPQDKNKPNPFLSLNQHFYDAVNENFDLKIMPSDYKIFKDKDVYQRSGIYFTVNK